MINPQGKAARSGPPVNPASKKRQQAPARNKYLQDRVKGMRYVRMAWYLVLLAGVSLLLPVGLTTNGECSTGGASTATQTHTIVFSPTTASLDNPVTARQRGTKSQITLALTVYNDKGNTITPSKKQPVTIHLHGVPSGIISPLSTQVTNDKPVKFSYSGAYFPNPVTVEAYMKLGGSAGYAIGVTQILPQNAVQDYGTRSFTFPYWCDNTADPDCKSSAVKKSLKLSAAVGYNSPAAKNFQNFGLDTGSLGVIVPVSSLGANVIGPAGKGIKFYDSSGNTYEGKYYLAPVVISTTANNKASTVKTFPIKVLAIDKAYCATGYPECEKNPPKPDLRYIGVGFDRNSTTPGDYFNSPADNPFLQISSDKNGTDINPGYVLTRTNGKIGITEAEVAGYHLTPLGTNTTVSGDWNAVTGCFGFPDLGTQPQQFCGSLLMDVGIPGMFIDLVPGKRPAGTVDITGTGVPSGTVMSVMAGTQSWPAMQYQFTYSPSINPPGLAPSAVKWHNPNPPDVFVNTGRNVLNGFNYLFDARHGDVGFKLLDSHFIPFLTTEFSHTEKNKYHVYISTADGPAHPVVVDTGSQILVVPKKYVGKQAKPVKPTQCHSISYGDNTTWCGRFYSGAVAIGVPSTYSGNNTYPTTDSSFQFLVADPDDSYCISQLSGCSMPKDFTNRGIMGVGFGQGTKGPAYNALLQLQEVSAGTMRPGYIIQLGNSTPGVTVGLTPDNTQGFGFVPLNESTQYPGQWDPNSFTGCVSLTKGGGSPAFSQCANMLFDTGTVNFTLKTPTADEPLSLMTNPPQIDAGTTVAITVPGTSPVASYTYASTSPGTWASSQSSVSWEDREKGIFFLIGQYIFTQYDYLFDPMAGQIGFKALTP